MTSKTPPHGLEVLVDRCPHMRRAFDAVGAPEIRRRAFGFHGLLRTIVGQQVSSAAGDSIWRKIEAAFDPLTPAGVLAANDETLRALGFSRAKARYAKALAHAVESGTLDMDGLEHLGDDEARALLMELPGIGPWTADIYLMFCLGRPDVWPVGDLALATAAQSLLKLRKRPTPDRLERIGAQWQPWRSAAAQMLWRYYGNVPVAVSVRGRSRQKSVDDPSPAPGRRLRQT